jgi:alpha-tubulin suppressor-like RCC1 family protein
LHALCILYGRVCCFVPCRRISLSQSCLLHLSSACLCILLNFILFPLLFLLSSVPSVFVSGFGNCGELARSARMTSPDEKGDYNLRANQFYTVKGDSESSASAIANVRDSSKEGFVRHHFLTPSPVRWSWGSHTGKKVLSVACGQFHLLACAREPGESAVHLYSSGLNNYGQLGLGDDRNRHELTLVCASATTSCFVCACLYFACLVTHCSVPYST